jgi:hypothetical protein
MPCTVCLAASFLVDRLSLQHGKLGTPQIQRCDARDFIDIKNHSLYKIVPFP